jgi:hypothetical protein
VEIETTLDRASGKLPSAFQIQPVAADDQVFEPALLSVEDAVAPPPPATTVVRARTVHVGAARWLNVRSGLASFTAQIEVQVDGQLIPNTVFLLLAPSSVKHIKIVPGTIHGGRQTLTVHLQAQLRPARAQTMLVFQIQPPPPQGGVVIRADAPFHMNVPGPSPARLALMLDGRVQPSMEITVADNQTQEFAFPARLVALGIEPQITHGLRASLAAGGHLALTPERPLEIGQDTILRLRPTVEPSPWFFRDAVLEGELRTISSSPAAIGSTQKVQVRVQSPFKRLMLQLTLGVCGIGALTLLLRLFFKLRTPT